MKIAIVAFGNAGGKIADKMLEFQERTDRELIADLISINAARADLRKLETIPESKKILIGQSIVKGQGVGADNSKGAEITRKDLSEIQTALNKLPVHEIDAFLVTAGLGGGTGSGGAPIVAEELNEIFDEPVYGLGMLPGKDEGGIYQLNAATSFQSMARNTDNLILFDNEAWKESGESLEQGYDWLNEELAKRLVTLLSAGEMDDSEVAENVVDSNEIINTLGQGGVSTIGFAKTPLDSRNASQEQNGILDRFTDPQNTKDKTDKQDRVSRTTSLVRQAVMGQMTLPCDITSTERALVLVSGPANELSRKGVERSRTWIQEKCETREVRGGDDPRDDMEHLAGLVLLSGIHNIPRIEDLKSQGVKTKRSMDKMEEESKDNFEDLLTDDNDELDPVV